MFDSLLTWLATASTRVSGTSESDMMNGGVKSWRVWGRNGRGVAEFLLT
jgi:hypothetical protein